MSLFERRVAARAAVFFNSPGGNAREARGNPCNGLRLLPLARSASPQISVALDPS